MLDIQNIALQVGERNVLSDFSLSIYPGEIHALMGQNGEGKSSLAKAIAGHPDYRVQKGQILFQGEDITSLRPEEIAKKGIFFAMQYPVDIPGVSVANFIRAAMNAQGKKMETLLFYKKLYETMEFLGLDRSFSSRAINVGFSGGEKKRCEILQLLMLEPQFVILDEIDSGLDIDALKTVANGINSMRSAQFSALIITHYQRLLDYVQPDRVHLLSAGKISLSGGVEIVQRLEESGYGTVKEHQA